MNNNITEISEGRTDLIYKLNDQEIAQELPFGMTVLKWCWHYGDVSAIRFLLGKGMSLTSLGDNCDLYGAAFHGHWQLCKFLIEQGADVNYQLPDTGETPLHSAICTKESPVHTQVVKVLIDEGADPNIAANVGVETSCFMRDIRTKGETPMHRAAAFGTLECIDMLLEAGAKLDVKDANGDSPLTWGSWHLRPAVILKKLCYGRFHIYN